MRGEEVIEYPADQSMLTRRYTEAAIKFMKASKDKPFFIYLPHTMCHVPLHPSKEFTGRTKSKFGDVIAVGELQKAVKDLGLDDNTLVIFTTDNGAASGLSQPLRGKKASLFEGASASHASCAGPARSPRARSARRWPPPSTCCPPWRSWPAPSCRNTRSTARRSGR